MADDDTNGNLPQHVLGRTLAEHRKDSMQKILGFLNETGYSRYNKNQLMRRLSEVERRMSYAQEQTIESWLIGGSKGPIVNQFTPEGERRSQLPSKLPPFRVTKRKRIGKSAPKGYQNTRIAVEDSPEPPEPPELKVQLKECCICAEELTFGDFPDQITGDCGHDATCCFTCLSRAIGTQIESKPWDQITCPECPALLSFDNVKSFASVTDFVRYDRNALLSYIRNDPSFTNCLGPDCNDGQIHDDGDDQPIMTCRTCGFKTCFTHHLPWHTGLTCRQYDDQQKKRVEQDQASQAYLDKESMECPACGAHVSKTIGCDHMKCKCGADFCYKCGVDYKVLKGDNDKHKPTCPYYSGNLPRHPQQAPDDGPRVVIARNSNERRVARDLARLPQQVPDDGPRVVIARNSNERRVPRGPARLPFPPFVRRHTPAVLQHSLLEETLAFERGLDDLMFPPSRANATPQQPTQGSRRELPRLALSLGREMPLAMEAARPPQRSFAPDELANTRVTQLLGGRRSIINRINDPGFMNR